MSRNILSITVALMLVPGCGDDSGGGNQNNNNNQNNTGCGNGVVDSGEECDDGDENSDLDPDACRTDCRDAHCGDGVADTEEDCDADDLRLNTCSDHGLNRGTLACTASCDFDLSACYHCGNGIIEVDEQCDASELQGETCSSLTGLNDGALTCSNDCLFDTSGCFSCGNSTIEGPEECDDGNVVDWDGCRDCANVEFQVNTHTPDDQTAPSVATASDGSFVVAWQSYLQGGNDNNIFAQRFDVDGNPAGTEFQVNTSTVNEQRFPKVAAAADGRFAVVFDNETTVFDVYCRRYNSSGIAAGAPFLVNTETLNEQYWASAAMAADGSFVVVWNDNGQDLDLLGVYGQRYNSNGTPAGSEFRANVVTAGSQMFPRVAGASDGKFVVVWTLAGDPQTVYARTYAANGSPSGQEFVVGTADTGGFIPRGHDVAMASDGSFVVVWATADIDGLGITGQRYDSNGSPVGSLFQANTYTTGWQRSPSVSMASDGRFVVVWQSPGQDGDGQGAFGQLYDAGGNPVGQEFQINVYTSGDQEPSSVAMTPDGNFVVVWSSEEQEGTLLGLGVFAQRYNALGEPRGRQPW